MTTLRHLLFLAAVPSMMACGAAQGVISTQATVVRATQHDRFDFYQTMDEGCFERHPELMAYRECMLPARYVQRAADSYVSALRGAQEVLDAAGEDSFEAMLPGLVRAAAALVHALENAGVPVPAAVLQVSRLVGGAQ